MEAEPIHVHVLNIYLQHFVYFSWYVCFYQKKVLRKKFHWFIIIWVAGASVATVPNNTNAQTVTVTFITKIPKYCKKFTFWLENSKWKIQKFIWKCNLQCTCILHFIPPPYKMSFGITVQITGSSRDTKWVKNIVCSPTIKINLSTLYRDKTQEKKITTSYWQYY